MLELLTLLTFVALGVFAAFKCGSWKKMPTFDFLVLTLFWFVMCCFIDLFATERLLFYSNDQEAFVNAAVNVYSCVRFDCSEIDFRYLTQSVPAALFISFGLEPLNVLKGLNYLCWILLYRLYLSYSFNTVNTKFLKNKYIKFIFLGPTLMLFSIIGNRDLIVVLLFCIFFVSLYKHKFFSCMFVLLLMFVLRFQSAILLFFLLLISKSIKIRQYSFLKSSVLALGMSFGCALFGQIMLNDFFYIYGYYGIQFESILNFKGIIVSVFNLFGLGFLFSSLDTSPNSILKLLAARIIFFDTLIYLAFAVSFILFPSSLSKTDSKAESLRTWIIAIALFYGVISYHFSFFSLRQNLPFFYMLIMVHLMSKTTDRSVRDRE